MQALKKTSIHCLRTSFIVVMLLFFALPVSTRAALKVSDVAPRCWWVGVGNNPVQVLIYGEDLKNSQVTLTGKDITIEEIIYPANAHYVLLYLNMSKAQPQHFNIVLKKGTRHISIPYDLLARRTDAYAQGFDASDVVYLLMPDRFANRSSKNDKVRGFSDDIVSRASLSARHGGDLEGITAHLDYLQRLGVTTLWPTPVLTNNMPSTSYHGYAITNYYEVDPRFGGNEAYRTFVSQAHQKGMKVVMDMVFNHCGSENYLFRDMPDSTWFNHGNHYVQTNFETPSPSDSHAAESVTRGMTDGWFTESMPDWNHRNRLVADYLIQNSIWWIEYAGIDGIRQDTYPYCDFDMMARWCHTLTTLYPHLNIVGETWSDNTANISYWQKNSPLNSRNSYLPTVMDFPLMNALNNYNGQESLQAIYRLLSGDCVYADPQHLLTFMGNHDTSRFCHNAAEATDLPRYKQALALLLTLRGIPQLYYGTEIMMYGDKSNGDGALRHDFPGGWDGDSINAFTGKGLTPVQSEALQFTSKLLTWRRGNDVVTKGSLQHYPVRNGVYVIQRVLNNRCVTVLVNGSNKTQILTSADYPEALPATEAYDVLSNATIRLNNGITLAPQGLQILQFTK